MGTYQAGDETKELILRTCKKLFYEKGYKETTARDISKATHTNISAISYHFGGKDGIRQIIIDQILDAVTLRASNISNDFGMRYIIGGYILWYMIYNDEKFRRFYCGFVIDQESSYFENPLKDFLVYLYTVFDVNYTKPDALARKYDLQIATALLSEKVCCEYVLKDLNRYTYYEMAEMNTRLEGTLLGIPEEVMKKKFREARKLLKTMDMSIYPTDLN